MSLNANLVSEDIFLPLSVRLTPMRNPGVVYTPLPIDDVSELRPLRKRKRERKTKRNSKRRKSLQNLAGTEICRERTTPRMDVYYGDRLKSFVTIDSRLGEILKAVGNSFFQSKSIYEFNSGVGLNAFYIAAYLGASRVVALENNADLVLENLKQLRKFKHDGIPICHSPTEDYLPLFVKRCGVVRVTNKPWLVDPQVGNGSGFPFNIEFRHSHVVEQSTRYDICLAIEKSVDETIIKNSLAVAKTGVVFVNKSLRPWVNATYNVVKIIDKFFYIIQNRYSPIHPLFISLSSSDERTNYPRSNRCHPCHNSVRVILYNSRAGLMDSSPYPFCVGPSTVSPMDRNSSAPLARISRLCC